MRGLKSTIALVALLGGLGAYIYFVDSKREGPALDGAAAKDKVFAVEADTIEELTVTLENEKSVLKKVDGNWRMTEPVQADADQTEASSLTTNLASLEVDRVVDENAADLAQYGLAAPRVRVAFKGQNGAAGEILIGEKTATQGNLYAVKPGEKRVFLVPAFQESVFNKKPFDLRDKRILTVKRDDIDRLEMTSGSDVTELSRTGTEWGVKRPVQARGDYSTIEGLLTRISGATMTKMVEQAPSALAPEVLAKYGLDKPVLTVDVGAGSSRATLAIGKEENGTVYARDVARPMIFTIDPTFATDLKKPADEYRNKNLFEFRPFNLARLRVVRGSNTYELTKVVGTGATATDKWTLSANGAAAADVDPAKIDDFLNKLANLRIQSFATAGAPQPELVVSSSHDEGKFERVRIGQAGGDVLATRDGEPGAGKLDATNYEDAIKALDAVIAPPAPKPAS